MTIGELILSLLARAPDLNNEVFVGDGRNGSKLEPMVLAWHDDHVVIEGYGHD